MRTHDRLLLAALIAAIALVAIRPAADARAQDSDEPGSIAVCDVYKVVERLMESDRYAPAREELTSAGEAEVRPMRETLESMEGELRQMAPDAPEREQAERQFRAAQMEFQRVVTEIQREINNLTEKQLKECWNITRSSAEAVAADLGYDVVVASRELDKPLEGEDVPSIIRAMMSRPAIVFPDKADITWDVSEDLNLN